MFLLKSFCQNTQIRSWSRIFFLTSGLFWLTACGQAEVFDSVFDLATNELVQKIGTKETKRLALNKGDVLQLNYALSQEFELHDFIVRDEGSEHLAVVHQDSGVRLCRAELKQQFVNHQSLIATQLSRASVESQLFYNLDEDRAIHHLKEELAKQGIQQSMHVASISPCLFELDEDLLPAYETEFFATDHDEIERPYLVYMGGNDQHAPLLTQPAPLFFKAAGKMNAYKYNPKEGEVHTYTISDLSGNDYLENPYFTVSTSGTLAKADDNGDFLFPPSDERFTQTSIFVNANLHHDFAKEYGYVYTTPAKINLSPHAVVDGSPNNALYTARTASSPPRIEVGDGDGYQLQNLGIDADVVFHEFSHHIIYDNVKNTSGESLVFHEGFADTLTLLHTDDACLGESICPEGSPLNCESPKSNPQQRCLRTADNDYVLNVNTRSAAHFKSQFISGLMWNLRQELGLEVVRRLTMKSITYMLKDSGYHDMVISLILADLDLNEGANCEAIYQEASNRGLGDYIQGFNCTDRLPNLSLLNNDGGGSLSNQTTTQQTNTRTSSGGGFCGSIGMGHNHPQPLGSLLFLLMLPIILLYGLSRHPHAPAAPQLSRPDRSTRR